jgi:polysaccharide biosynthesis protein PslH
VRILFLTHRLPYAPNRGDRIRSYHLLRAMRHAELHLFSLVDSDERGHLGELPDSLASVTVAQPRRLRNYIRAAFSLAGGRPLTHTLLEAPESRARLRELAAKVQFDVVFAYCTGIAPLAMEEPLRPVPCVLDMVDVDSEKWRSLAGKTRFPMRSIYAREAAVLRPFEAAATAHAAATLVVNDRERRALREIAPAGSIEVIENGVDCEFFRNPSTPAESEGIVFCGVMNYAPNVDGMVWFVERVWPLVREARPSATLTIVGADPNDSVKRLAALPGVRVTGAVHDVRPFLWGAAVAIAPIFTSRGVQNKVLEALAAGLPIVTTSAVRDGLPSQVADACRVTDDPRQFRDDVLRLLAMTPAERRAVSKTAYVERLGWEARLARIPALLEAAACRLRQPEPERDQ